MIKPVLSLLDSLIYTKESTRKLLNLYCFIKTRKRVFSSYPLLLRRLSSSWKLAYRPTLQTKPARKTARNATRNNSGPASLKRNAHPSAAVPTSIKKFVFCFLVIAI
jgi:hypothetical protein